MASISVKWVLTSLRGVGHAIVLLGSTPSAHLMPNVFIATFIGSEKNTLDQSKRVGAREKTILAIETTTNACYSVIIPPKMSVAREMCNGL